MSNHIVDATKMVKPISECTTVAELLADPARWTKKTSARNEEGISVRPTSEDATCFCLLGAIYRVCSNQSIGRATKKLMHILGVSIDTWNDAPERTHAEVLDLVRRAGI